MFYIVLFALSLSSTSCGAQEWFDDKVEEGKDIVDEAQDQWIYDRSFDVIKSYNSLLYSSLTTSRFFNIDGRRCSEDTLCMSLFKAETARTELFELSLNSYNNIRKYTNIFSVCEDYRVNLNSKQFYIKELTKNLEELKKRLENPSMTDTLQFGDQIDSIGEYYLRNTQMILQLKAELSKTAYQFTYIYPSEKYNSFLPTRKNPLRQP